MQFEFDPPKSQANKIKHGIDFEEAQALWDDAFGIVIQASFKEEKRFGLIGNMTGTMWTAIFTMRGDAVRIISCRRSRKDEVAFYEQERRKHN